MERRLAGPGDLVREALVGGLAGATPVETAYFSVQKPGLGMRWSYNFFGFVWLD